MSEPVSLIMLQFLDWVASRSRTYAEAMDAWRTSCPRLSVWEDAVMEGFIQFEGAPSQPARVLLTSQGKAILDRSRSTVRAHVARTDEHGSATGSDSVTR